MEEIQLSETTSALENRAADASCADELTRTNSGASSLTTEDSEEILQQKPNATQCECEVRTNEKHDQYLSRLEASFVNQLYQSMGRVAWSSEQSINGRKRLINQPTDNASDQFSVSLEDCRHDINNGKRPSNDSYDALKSPWVKHFKYAGKPCSKGSDDALRHPAIHQKENVLIKQKVLSLKVERCAEDLPVIYTSYYGSPGSVTEGSGQNFVDEDCGHDSRPRIKKLKTSGADTSSDDQIVPSRKLNAIVHQSVLLLLH